MAIYKTTVYIANKELERINRLLAIESLEDMTNDELLANGANTDVCEGLFFVEFDNGATMTIDLCSGTHNYYDNVVWYSPDKKYNIVLDCAYELDDIEVEIDSNTYIVEIIKD